TTRRGPFHSGAAMRSRYPSTDPLPELTERDRREKQTSTRCCADPAVAGGRVLSVGNAPEGIAVGTSGIAAVAVRNPDGVVLIDVDTGAVRRTVPTTGAARHLSLATPGGP